MFKLNTQRSFKAPVAITVLDPEGAEHSGEFSAHFRVMNQTEMAEKPTARLLDEVLIDIEDLELRRGDTDLHGTELIDAAKADPALSAALVAAYWEHLVKKPRAKT